MKTVFIYALCEPGTRTVRYIGKTNKLRRRYQEHLRLSITVKTHLGRWLASLSVAPEMIVLSEVSCEESADEEIRFIAAARMLGMNLVNSSDGGDGCTNPSPETRAKLVAAANSPEALERQRKAALGNHHALGSKRTAEQRKQIRRTHSTPEFVALKSEQTRKLWASPDFKARQIEAHSTPEARASMSAKTSARMSVPAARSAASACLKARWSSPISTLRESNARPESRAKKSLALKALWKTPEYREKIMAARRLAKLSNCPPVV